MRICGFSGPPHQERKALQGRGLVLSTSAPRPRVASLQVGRENYLFTPGSENLSGVAPRVVWE